MRPNALKGLLIVALLAGAAGQVHAQGAGAAPMNAPPKSPQDIERERQLERKYQESLKRIPDKAPADPWGNVRSTDADPAPVKPVRTKPAPKPAPKGTAAATPQ
jgi:hypothetical protein